MLNIQTVDLSNRKMVHQFIQFPFSLYKHDPFWVPPLWVDMKTQMNPRKNPFFEHSVAVFFLAHQDGQMVGRIAAINNRRFNHYHDSKKAQFYYFECIDDFSIASALFEQVFEWSCQQGMDQVIGPKGLGPLDGYGMLIDGFDQRNMMTMMNYNPPYYPIFLERLGFTKEVDFVSCLVNLAEFHMPERIYRIAKWVERNGELKVHNFRTVKELKKWASKIGETSY